MKLVGGMFGAPIRPDYDMLRGALIAAQRATSTGRLAAAARQGHHAGTTWQTLALEPAASSEDAGCIAPPPVSPWPSAASRGGRHAIR